MRNFRTTLRTTVVAAVLLAFAGTLGAGCNSVISCILSRAFESQIAGPFVAPPDMSHLNRDPDAITVSTQIVYFFWTNPDMEVGESFTCRIVAAGVEGINDDHVMGSMTGTMEERRIGGQASFTSPPGGWLPGAYRAEMLAGDGEAATVFASVEFAVLTD